MKFMKNMKKKMRESISIPIAISIPKKGNSNQRMH